MGKITRRDFVNGSLLAAGTSALPWVPGNQAALAALDPSYYPPARTGLRGSHPGSNEVAHERAWTGRSDWGPIDQLDEVYDLVIVGGGLSGLAAAWFFRQQHGRGSKILILDNHDDFGGHAKRNEHTIDGRLRISYGGSQTLVEPAKSNPVLAALLADISVDVKRFDTAYDRSFFKRHDLSAVTYFNADVFGEDRLVRHPFCNYPNYIEGIQMAQLSDEEAVRQTPLSVRGKQQLLRVLKGGLHELNVPAQELQTYMKTTRYFDYLKNTLGVDDPGVLRMARHSALDWAGSSAEIMSLADAKFAGALGFAPRAVFSEQHPYIHHFPDGNAGIARALVKNLIPDVAKGSTAEELVLARFNYAELDKPGNSVRLRLNSTAVNIEHVGKAQTSEAVFATYVNGGTSYRVRAGAAVMACYNMIIPHIVTGMPGEQAAALRQQQKSPLQYTTVGLRNWRAFKEMGIGMAMSPGNRHQAVLMDFPVSMGGYAYSDDPDEACIVQMICCPYGSFGAPKAEQFREARAKMLALSFDDYEQEIRAHLGGMLPAELFAFERDVASISVNRWAHGYSNGGPGESTRIGRQPFGRITIANSDSAPGADAKIAMMMAHRAVNELG